MATTPLTWWTVVRTRAGAQSTYDLAGRVVLAAIAVVVCYQFRWETLRYVTSELNLRLDALVGVHWQRLSFDTVAWHAQVYHYVVACTFVDVWCGAIPFLWMLRRSIPDNLLTIAGFTAVLFACKICRLSFSDLLFAHGVSWNLGHNFVGGICYFLIWEWLMRYRRRYISSE